MLNSPEVANRAEKRSKTRNPIVPQFSAVAQDQQEDRSPDSSPQDADQKRSLYPPLPPHLDELLDAPWTPESSRQIDRWLDYISIEFGGWA